MKTNEAIKMRCQISLARMAQLLIDDAKYSGKGEPFGDSMLSTHLSELHADIGRAAKKTGKNVRHRMPHTFRRNNRNNSSEQLSQSRQPNKPRQHCDEDRFEVALPSESWLKFVQRDRNEVESPKSITIVSETEKPRPSVLSPIIKIKKNNSKSPDTAQPNKCPSVEDGAKVPETDSCGENATIIAREKVEKPTISPNPCTISLETNNQTDSEDQSKTDLMVAQRRLSEYKSSSPTKCLVKNDYRYRISYLNGHRRRLVNGFSDWRSNHPDINRVCINGSKAPQTDSKSEAFSVGKKFNKFTINQASFETRIDEGLVGWKPDKSRTSVEVPHCGEGISQYSFKSIHVEQPRICSSAHSLLEYSDISVCGSISSASVNTYSPRTDSVHSRSKNSEDDPITQYLNSLHSTGLKSRGTSAVTRQSNGGYTTSSTSSHLVCSTISKNELDTNNNVDIAEEDRDRNRRTSAKERDGDTNDVKGGDDNVSGGGCCVESSANVLNDGAIGVNDGNANNNDIYSDSDDVHGNVIIDINDKADDNDDTDKNEVVDDNNNDSVYHYGSCSYATLNDVNSSFGIYASPSSSLESQTIGETPKLLDGISDSFCSESLPPPTVDTSPTTVQSFGIKAETDESLDMGYYQGISARYIQPVVVPPPFPGRDRSNMVMKVKVNEANRGINNTLVKFKSDVKLYSTTRPQSVPGRDNPHLPIKTYKLDVKRESESKQQQARTGRRHFPTRTLNRNPEYKPMDKNQCSFVERNIKSVNSPRLKYEQRNVLRLPVIDCDIHVLSRFNGDERY